MENKCGHRVTESVKLSTGSNLTTYVSQIACQRSPGHRGFHSSASDSHGIAWESDGTYHDRNEKVV